MDGVAWPGGPTGAVAAAEQRLAGQYVVQFLGLVLVGRGSGGAGPTGRSRPSRRGARRSSPDPAAARSRSYRGSPGSARRGSRPSGATAAPERAGRTPRGLRRWQHRHWTRPRRGAGPPAGRPARPRRDSGRCRARRAPARPSGTPGRSGGSGGTRRCAGAARRSLRAIRSEVEAVGRYRGGHGHVGGVRPSAPSVRAWPPAWPRCCRAAGRPPCSTSARRTSRCRPSPRW